MDSNTRKDVWWVGTGYEQEEPGVYICDEKGIVVVSSDTVPSEEQARRIVACLNACAGVDTDDLENVQRNAMPPGFLVSKCKESDWHMEQAARMKSERDQLLAALRDCVLVMERDLEGLKVIQPELNGARAAIAAVEQPKVAPCSDESWTADYGSGEPAGTGA